MVSEMRQGGVAETPLTCHWAAGFRTFPQLNPGCPSARLTLPPPSSALLVWLWPSSPKQWVQLMRGFMDMKINTSQGQERDRFMRLYGNVNLPESEIKAELHLL